MINYSCHLLGTASGIPTKTRNNVSIVLAVNNDYYILDAGEPCAASMLRNGLDYNKVKAIFISHMDADHFAGLPMLIKSMILWARRRKPLKLFVPRGAVADVKNCLAMMYLVDEARGFRLDILPLSEEFEYWDNNISMTFHGNRHIKNRFCRNPALKDKYPDLQKESFSFCIVLKNREMVYSGDLACLEEMDAFINGTDILLCELAHFTPEMLFQYLSDKSVKRIICLHFHPDWDDRNAELLELASKYGIKNIEMGRDNLQINF
ncbi:MAG: ribonuclease Z [Victivallaceae bacterium]|nr:ribonuclease Z [Victivallaceae bacterium]